MSTRREQCRICGAKDLHLCLDLGSTPLANRFLKNANPGEPEPRFPLELYLCTGCSLLQLGHVVPGDVLFRDYIYVTGTSDTMPRHFADLAQTVTRRFLQNSATPLVVEAGSNDGTLLRAFENNVRTLGVEPATNISELARLRGVETVNDFFTERSARVIVHEKGPAAALLGNNVFAHVDDIHDFVRGARALLASDGVFVFEVPYVFDMLDHVEFDTIYHEHLSYFSLTALRTLFEKHQMEIFDVERHAIHGGTIRVFVQKTGPALRQPSAAVASMLSDEQRRKVNELGIYAEFAARVYKLRVDLCAMLKELRAGGARIVGYGSPAKGNTLLNFMNIGSDLVDYLVDKSPLKQGLFTPGMRLPIYPVERLLADRPQYALILAWNFADEIVAQQSSYVAQGGRFLVPLPRPTWIN